MGAVGLQVRRPVGARRAGRHYGERRGGAALARTAEGLQALPAARYIGELAQRGAERSGGFRGVVPPG